MKTEIDLRLEKSFREFVETRNIIENLRKKEYNKDLEEQKLYFTKIVNYFKRKRE